MNTPVWALSLAYWMHMLATVTWIGGLAVFTLLVLPAARRTLDADVYAALVERFQTRFDAIGWFSVAVLLGSGMLQMSANPNYEGFLAINSRWAVAILIKHLIFVVMIAVSAAITWGVLPALRRAALLRARGRETPELPALLKRGALLMRLNLALGVIVLALTALARAS
ncbi:MAG: hypothetical protein D6803_06415 [Anaerolineae bacterium]|nr:MAG: hypothetical protein D6803_06415 [Anaerolineae bacterium]